MADISAAQFRQAADLCVDMDGYPDGILAELPKWRMLLLAAAEQREQLDSRCSCEFDKFGSPPSHECPFHSERDIQQRQQIATLTAERNEARATVIKLTDNRAAIDLENRTLKERLGEYEETAYLEGPAKNGQ